MPPRLHRLFIALAILSLAATVAFADEPHAQFRLDGGQPHVGMPFTLQLIVEGFDESPPPEMPTLIMPSAQITPLGAAQPNVSRSIQIVNGHRTDSTSVTWALQWRVQIDKEGKVRVPQTTVTQGSKKATAAPGEVDVVAVPSTDDMKLTLDLPNRPVFVGESVPVTMTWLFRSEPQDQTFSIPIMASDSFTVSAPAPTSQGGGRPHVLTVSAGTKDLQLGYTLDQTSVNGVQFNRLRATFFAAPKKVGKVDVPAVSVVAALPVGRPDFFGSAPTHLFRAADVARTFEVKPLPETDRPVTFAGAVGDQFSIGVHTSRSVVSLGEPMELDVTIKANQPLDTLALGRMDGEGRLPKDLFTVPPDAATGELSDEGKTKTFKITAQVVGPATEIPALAFAYFDPTKSAYQTIHSEPIALQMKGGNVVGANDVVAMTPTKKPTPPGTQPAEPDMTNTVGADLALSSMTAVSSRPLGGTFLWVLVGLLYALPIAMFAARTYQLRTADSREEAGGVRTARKKVEALLDTAGTKSARDVAGPLAAALRELAKSVGREVDTGLLAKLETEAFSPAARDVPLSADLRYDAAGLLRRLSSAPSPATKTATLAAFILASLFATHAHASSLDDGRTAYQQAMQVTGDASARKAAFTRAATSFAAATHETPDRPELLTDWGTASLAAGDVATATLAYRRALLLDRSNARARHNLDWLRSRQGDSVRSTSTASDTLFFFHQWPTPRKLIIAAIAFAITVLWLVPWSAGFRRWRGLAVIPALVWLALTLSVLLEDKHANDAVVMDDVILRAADSTGAPAALTAPLPRGVEVVIREQRDAWTRIELASGTLGWVPAGAVERVVR
ncbi:hypothetical protein BH11MYX2_BH11MYX2_22170 [soil metagenome]